MALVWLLRIAVGGTFIVSGWAKAVDPWGGLFKFEDYLAAMDVTLARPVVLIGVCALFLNEMCCGVMVLMGTFRRTVTWLLAAFMAVMTALTVWIYASDPVSDCGCFGDLWVISNGATFAKNIVLCVLVGLLVWLNPRVACGIAPRLQWTVPAFTGFYAMAIAVVGFNWQPLVDFRPFAVGERLTARAGDEDVRYAYVRNGERKEFSADSLPGDDWEFVERVEAPKTANSLVVYDGEDEATSLLSEWSHEPGGLLILNIPEPRHHGISRSRQANLTSEFMTENDGMMVALIGEGDADAWRQAVDAHYDVFTAEGTDLKMLSRGDASYVFMRNDTVQWKYNINALNPDTLPVYDIKAIERGHWLRNLTLIYLASMLVVFLLSFFGLKIIKPRQPEAKKKAEDANGGAGGSDCGPDSPGEA